MKMVHQHIGLGALLFWALLFSASAQDRLTPLQHRIEAERQRLGSSEIEERRDALMKLGAMKNADAARAAVVALNDPEPIIRVTAAHAIVALPANEAASLLIPLTKEKTEFVRREAAYALGETHSPTAVAPLAALLSTDKEDSVRAAAAVSLGEIGDETGVNPLIQVLSGTAPKKSKKRDNEFVLRAAAEALGRIHSRAALEVLIATLGNEAYPTDVRRAAATSLGLIGDASAKLSLQAAASSNDFYLSEAAREALRRLRAAGK